jgi:hypothetical protein
LKIYDYIYIRTFKIISKVNKNVPYSSTARLLSILAFVNLMSILLLFINYLPEKIFIFGIALGIIISFYILNRFNDPYAKQIVNDYSLTPKKKYFDKLIDFYPEISILFFTISANVGVFAILNTLMLIVMIRIIFYLASKQN